PSVLNTIQFNIPGSGIHTISPLSQLPTVLVPLLMDGYTQPGSTPNTSTNGHNGVLLIELDGSQSVGGAGLVFNSCNNIIRGLVINRWGTWYNNQGLSPAYGAIAIQSPGGNRIEGNFIGTDPTGMLDRGNFGPAIYISGGSDNTVGGLAPGQRNVICANHDSL